MCSQKEVLTQMTVSPHLPRTDTALSKHFYRNTPPKRQGSILSMKDTVRPAPAWWAKLSPKGLRKRTAHIPAAHEWPRGPWVLLVFRTERGRPLLLRGGDVSWPPTTARVPQRAREEGKEGDLCDAAMSMGTHTARQTRGCWGDSRNPAPPQHALASRRPEGRQRCRWGGLPKAGSRGADGAAGEGPRVGQGGFRGIRRGLWGMTEQRLAWRAGRKEGSSTGRQPPAEKGQVQQSSPQTNTIG